MEAFFLIAKDVRINEDQNYCSFNWKLILHQSIVSKHCSSYKNEKERKKLQKSVGENCGDYKRMRSSEDELRNLIEDKAAQIKT